MREALVLLGAGGFARETAAAVAAIDAVEPRWDLLGFLDDDKSLHGSLVAGLPVVGPVALAMDLHTTTRLVVCTGSPRDFSSRRRIIDRLALKPSRYATLIHPDASLAHDTVVGQGSVVLAATVATANVRIGAHVALMPGCVLTHDVVVKDDATIGAGVMLSGGVVVGEGAYVGSGALVREGARLGERCLVGMGAVVLEDVPPGEVWVGSPARRLRPVVAEKVGAAAAMVPAT